MIEPGSHQWLEIRCGAITASRAPALMRRKKDGTPYADYSAMIGELAVERLTAQNIDHFVTDAMLRGRDLEPAALEAYEVETMARLAPSQYVIHPTMPRVGCTPDAFVGDDGLVQAKCPQDRMKHYKFAKEKENSTLFKEYEHQLWFEMFVTGRQWNDLCSYDPRYPANLQVRIVRVHRTDEMMDAVAAAIEQAEKDIADVLADLEQLTTGQVEAA